MEELLSLEKEEVSGVIPVFLSDSISEYHVSKEKEALLPVITGNN